MECTGEDTEKVVAVVAMDEGGGDIDGNYQFANIFHEDGRNGGDIDLSFQSQSSAFEHVSLLWLAALELCQGLCYQKYEPNHLHQC